VTVRDVLGAPVPTDRPRPIPAWAVGLGLVAGAAALATRRPDAFTNPQFWAEDGTRWYADAYDLGRLHALLLPYAGYYQTVSRLVGALAASLPLSWAPAIMNGVGLAIQVLPVLLLLTGRLDHLLGDWRLKVLLITAYVATPYSHEGHVTLTQGQWHLALVAVMVAIAAPPPTRGWKLFDVTAIVASGLTGPFALILVPVLLIRLIARRERWILLLFGLTAACGALQAAALLLTSDVQRPTAPIGFHPHLIANWVGGQIGVGLVLGEHGYALARTFPGWGGIVVLLAAAVAALCGWAVWKGPLELRMLVVWGALLVVALFAGRQTVPSDGSWTMMVGAGNRYRILPATVLTVVIVWSLVRSRRWSKLVPGLLLASILLVAGPLDWEYPAFRDLHFQAQARAFDASPPGTRSVFEVNPPGFAQVVVLTKR
jgi:hypothetical protein